MPDEFVKNVGIHIEASSSGFGPLGKELQETIANTARLSSSVKKSSDFMKQQMASVKQLASSFSNLTSKIAGYAGASISLGGSLKTVIDYNKQLIGLSGQWNKYGVSISQVESRVESLSKTLYITRSEVMSLASSFEKAFPYSSLDRFSKILTNIKNVTGADASAQKELVGSVSQLVNMYPNLQESAERLSETDKERLKTTARIALTTGKINRDLYSDIVKFAGQNKQISKSDEERLKISKEYLDTMGKMKVFWEKIALTIGKAIMPTMKWLAGFLEKHQSMIQKIVEYTAKWVVPMLVLKGVVGSIWGMFKGIWGMVRGIGGALIGGRGRGSGSSAVRRGISGAIGSVLGSGGGAGLPVKVTNWPVGMSGGKGGLLDSAMDMMGGRGGRLRGLRGITAAAKRGFRGGGGLRGALRGGTRRFSRQAKSLVGRIGRRGTNIAAARAARMSPTSLARMARTSAGGGFKGLAAAEKALVATKGVSKIGSVAKGGGMLMKGAKLASLGGIAALGGELGFGALESHYEKQGNKKGAAGAGLAKSASSIGGMALTGAAIGSILPVVGTGIGAGVGAIAGALMELPSIIKNTATLIKGTSFGKALSHVWDGTKNFFKKLGDGISDGLKVAGEWIGDKSSDFVKYIKKKWDDSIIGSFVNRIVDILAYEYNKAAAKMSQKVAGIVQIHENKILIARSKAEEKDLKSRLDRLAALTGKSTVTLGYKTKREKIITGGSAENTKRKIIEEQQQYTGKNFQQQQQKILELRKSAIEERNKAETNLEKDKGVGYTESKYMEGKKLKDKTIQFKATGEGLQAAEDKKSAIESALKTVTGEKEKEVLGKNLENINSVIEKINSKREKGLKTTKGMEEELNRLVETRRSIQEEQKVLMESSISLASAEVSKASAIAEKTMLTGNILKDQAAIKAQIEKADGALMQKESQINEYIESRNADIQLEKDLIAQGINTEIEKGNISREKGNEMVEDLINSSANIKSFEADIANKQAESAKITAERLNNQKSLLETTKQYLGIQSQLLSAQRAMMDAAIEYAVWISGDKTDINGYIEKTIEERKKEKDIAEGVISTYESTIASIKAKGLATEDEAAEIKKLNTDRLNAETNIKKFSMDVLKLRLEGIQKTYEAESALASQQQQMAEQSVQLMDSFVTGLGASVEMRMKAIEASQKELDINKKQINDMNNMADDQKKTPEWQKKMNELKIKELSITMKIADQAKALRDGWVDSIKSMQIGSGRISKIVIDQNKNLGLGLEYLDGMVRTYKSGAMGRTGEEMVGAAQSERFMADAYSGGINIAGARSSAAYNVDTGIDLQASNSLIQDLRNNNTSGAAATIQKQAQRSIRAAKRTGGASLAGEAAAAGVVREKYLGSGGGSGSLATMPGMSTFSESGSGASIVIPIKFDINNRVDVDAVAKEAARRVEKEVRDGLGKNLQ